MNITTIRQIAKNYNQISEEEQHIYEHFNWDERRNNPEIQKRLTEIYDEKLKLETELKKVNKIQIIKPSGVVAARLVCGMSSVELFDVNDLNRLELSETRQEGTIKTPYKFKLDGTYTKDKVAHYYKIKRIDGKVYWLIGIRDILDMEGNR